MYNTRRFLKKLQLKFRLWRKGEDAVAATEAALIFPILLTLLLGVFDMGNGVLANQKTIRASQVVGDLIARTNIVDDTELAEAVTAGRLALEPLPTDSYGVDIVSIRFDDDANAQIVWRETQNMSPVSDVLSRVDALASAGSGVMVVSVKYEFEPTFASFVTDGFTMQETAFTRGRNTAVIGRE